MNAAVCRDFAFDTVIMVKQTPRRMLAAVQEVCGIVAARLYTGDEETLDGRVAAVAYGVCRPDEARDANPRARWRILSGFAAHLEAGGMPETARAISRCQDRWRGRVEQLMRALEEEAPRAQGTRESERRRTAREHAGSEAATMGTPSQDARGGIGT